MQTQINFSRMLEIADQYTGILLDAYGVFWGGNAFGALPGAKETMKQLIQKGKIVGVLSNSTVLPRKEIDKLQAHEIKEGEHFHFYITSGGVIKKMFDNHLLFSVPKKKYWLFGGIHPLFPNHSSIFEGSQYQLVENVEEADFIYLSVPHLGGIDQTDPYLFRESLIHILHHQLPMVCANPDCFAHEGSPPKLVVRQGSIAHLYSEMGGQVIYVGKPYDKVFVEAMNEFKKFDISKTDQIVMVGDTPETDIRGANAFGISSALVTETGIMHERIKNANLMDLIQKLDFKDRPNYYLRRFNDDI